MKEVTGPIETCKSCGAKITITGDGGAFHVPTGDENPKWYYFCKIEFLIKKN